MPLLLKALAIYNKNSTEGSNRQKANEVSETLAICYCQLSRNVRDNPKEQMKFLHQGLYYRSDLDDSQKDLDDAITQLGKNPKSVNESVALGDEAQAAGDEMGAAVEYQAALKIKDDPSIRQKLELAKKAITSSPS